MPSTRILDLPSVRKQQLLVEFASLKHACPQGVYVSLTPGDSAVWSGVLFVRKGPYAPAILRFQISFPSAYPSLPPLIIFNTDIFHPLLTPLTTYTYTTGSSETETVSATDEERLPPGGFSLRHGFPQWFGRARKSAVPSATPSRNVSGSNAPDRTEKPDTPLPNSAGTPIASHSPLGIDHTAQISAAASLQKAAPPSDRDPCQISTIEVLRYMRSSFDTEAVLDSVPLEAAGNPGAWHAWRAYRRLKSPGSPSSSSRSSMDAEPVAEKDETAPTGYQRLAVGTSVGRARRPGEWNWEGVWELRVKKGVEASLSEPSLYGNNGSRDDLIRFLNMDNESIETVKENLIRSVEHRAAH